MRRGGECRPSLLIPNNIRKKLNGDGRCRPSLLIQNNSEKNLTGAAGAAPLSFLKTPLSKQDFYITT